MRTQHYCEVQRSPAGMSDVFLVGTDFSGRSSDVHLDGGAGSSTCARGLAHARVGSVLVGAYTGTGSIADHAWAGGKQCGFARLVP